MIRKEREKRDGTRKRDEADIYTEEKKTESERQKNRGKEFTHIRRFYTIIDILYLHS